MLSPTVAYFQRSNVVYRDDVVKSKKPSRIFIYSKKNGSAESPSIFEKKETVFDIIRSLFFTLFGSFRTFLHNSDGPTFAEEQKPLYKVAVEKKKSKRAGKTNNNNYSYAIDLVTPPCALLVLFVVICISK